MKNLLAGFIICLLFFSCKGDEETDSNLVNLIPSNSLYIIDTPHLGNFLNEIDSIDQIQNYSSFFTPEIKESIRFLNRYSIQESAIIALNLDERDNLIYVFIAKEQGGEINLDSVKNKSVETLSYDDFTIQKYAIEESTFFKGEKEGVFIASNSRQQLEAILDKNFTGMATDDLFLKAHSAIDRDKTSIIYNKRALSDLIDQSFTNVFLKEIYLADWSVIEIGSSNNVVSLNGISTWKEEENSLLKIFQNIGPQINEIAKITPADALGFYSFTYQDMDTLHKHLNATRNPENKLPENHFLHYTGEAGLITLKNDNKLPVLRATDPELANELLIPAQEVGPFRGVSIYEVPEVISFFEYLEPLIPQIELSYYIWIEDFIVFSENTADLQPVISGYLNNMTLGQQEYYTAAMENLAAASSLLLVANNARKSKSEEREYPVITMQFVVEKDFAHIHGAFGHADSNVSGNTSQAGTITLDAPLATLPFPVKNHLNGQPEIMVQDQENVLYLYSASGSLLWKKPFTHQIMGEVRQVDIFKNGNLQYAFSTPYALHVLDRNGNPVKPFPLEFRDEITQPLSVFDYDNNRTYRFVITQGNDALMYDARGRLVKGFDFTKVSSEIIQPPNHIRLNNKDYILVPESSGKLNILSRQGQSRIQVKKEIDFSATPWFPHKGNFISISSEGQLIIVRENGSVASEPIGENGNIKMAASGDIIVSLADNTLKINDRAVNLDYGLYTSPVIFNSEGKTFISLTDTQAQRIYVFDENANLHPGFPLYGNSEIRLLSTGKGSNIISVQGDDNEVILYQL